MAESRDLQWNRHDAAQRQDARDPRRFWSRIDDWQSTPCRSILLFRGWPLYSPSKSLVLPPLFFPIRGCIPSQRFLFHRCRFSSLCLSSATRNRVLPVGKLPHRLRLFPALPFEPSCYLKAHATRPVVFRPRDYQRRRKDAICKRAHFYLVIVAQNPVGIIIGGVQKELWILAIRKEKNGV